MRIIDSDGNEISNPDLTEGKLTQETIIKASAKPIDNEVKFAWGDDDYEAVLRYTVTPEIERIAEKISELKGKLEDTDYIAAKTLDSIVSCNKVTELLSVLSAVREEYGSTIETRAEWRKEINELEALQAKAMQSNDAKEQK